MDGKLYVSVSADGARLALRLVSDEGEAVCDMDADTARSTAAWILNVAALLPAGECS